jgi:NRAMP (natural resistance-associated macrophage protein)-like metal ion transporter
MKLDAKNNKTKQILLMLSIIGPGLITANADNDAGGITTYSSVGAAFGYKMLWGLFLITIALAVVQEMCSRMGVVTGKGLSALIRENFGVRMTFFAMVILMGANLMTTIAEFAGVAASMELFKVPKYISVCGVAIIVWLIIFKGSYKKAEKAFLVVSLVYFTYIIAGFLAKPDWHEVAIGTLIPHFEFKYSYIYLFIAMIGTTITPWMQFYLQASVVDKGIDIRHYKYEKADVFIGAFITDFVAFFIVVTTAATIYKFSKGGVTINTAADAVSALKPLAGVYAAELFAIGLFGASLLGASILPLSTAYAVTEAFGVENGLDKKFKEAPVFYGIILFLIIISAAVVLLPHLPLIKIMLLSQEINGILVPIILVYMLKLTNDKELMGEYTNTRTFNIVAWITVVFIIILTVTLLVMSVLG